MEKKLGKEYYENLAKKTLQHFYSDRYLELTKSECPDFVSENIGVEVRRAVTEKEGNIDALFREYEARSYSEIPPRRLEQLGFCAEPKNESGDGIIYIQRSEENGSLIFFKSKSDGELKLFAYFGHITTTDSDVDKIINAIIKKIEKLNKHYKEKEINELVIIYEEQLNYIGYEQEFIDDFMEKFKLAYNGIDISQYSNNFDFIYIMALDNLFKFDTETQEMTQETITGEVFKQISKEAYDEI